ncbi:MAG: hypothetical protein JSS91_12205 [Bacteroidetes bacterium]|nr:hypothetical protein [Bacteroidota bacterium]
MNLYESRLNYLERLSGKLQQRIEFLKKKSNKFSYRRLWIFLSGLIFTIVAFSADSTYGWIILALSLLSFGITVHFHNRLLHSLKRITYYKKIQLENTARMKVDWKNIPDPVLNKIPAESSVFKDLDITGSRSLHHLTDSTVSFEGSVMLAELLSRFSPDVKKIEKNQKIIKELSAMKRFRDKFILKARLISKQPLNGKNIRDWLKNVKHTSVPEYLVSVSFILILSYAALFILYSIGITGSIWFAVFLMYLFFYGKYQKKVSAVFEESSLLSEHVRKFSLLIRFMEKFPLSGCKGTEDFLFMFRSKGDGASDELKKFDRLISLVLLRENPVYRIILNLAFPFDFYLCRKLLKLISDIEHKIPQWLDKFNELECLISVANFSYLNPDYSYPEFDTESNYRFEVKDCGHPLIERSVKICNDFSFTKKGETVIITGSNMSGKSTFLKTLGINLCLANAGAPVNSKSFLTSVYNLFTCIKVNDSVTDGISYFYAEVKRLSELMDDIRNSGERKIFFLIDEIFKGTNNRERLTGSREFIKYLSGQNCAGFITTHDLELVNISDEINTVSNYHFREEISGDKMIFDYKIHKGPCPTTNALKIMEIAGLPV